MKWSVWAVPFLSRCSAVHRAARDGVGGDRGLAAQRLLLLHRGHRRAPKREVRDKNGLKNWIHYGRKSCLSTPDISTWKFEIYYFPKVSRFSPKISTIGGRYNRADRRENVGKYKDLTRHKYDKFTQSLIEHAVKCARPNEERELWISALRTFFGVNAASIQEGGGTNKRCPGKTHIISSLWAAGRHFNCLPKSHTNSKKGHWKSRWEC